MNKETESPYRMEPTIIEESSDELSDLISELYSKSLLLEKTFHPKTAQSLSKCVRVMNSYYSNLIEGNKTKPKDIEKALNGNFEIDYKKRILQLEAISHINIQSKIDEHYLNNKLQDPVSIEFIKWLHSEFYKDSPKEFLEFNRDDGESIIMKPGVFRSKDNEDVTVGRHIPPKSENIENFMNIFTLKYSENKFNSSTKKCIAMACAHHRFNFIHPFLDGNGRVSRLMSHAMAQKCGIGSHGLWSISRGLSRGLSDPSEYKKMMDYADSPRFGDLDGRGHLSKKALIEFCEWFFKVCIDQIQFMTEQFEVGKLNERFEKLIEHHLNLKKEGSALLKEAFLKGEFSRGEASRITGLPERSARRVLKELIDTDILKSKTPKSTVFLNFNANIVEILFPILYG